MPAVTRGAGATARIRARRGSVRPGRLLLTLYLGVVVLAFGAAGLFLANRVVRPASEAAPLIARHVLDGLLRWRDDPARLRAELTAISELRLDASLYGADRQLLATTVTPPLALADGGVPDRLRVQSEIRDRDRVVVIGVAQWRRPSFGRGIGPLAILLGALVVMVVVIARQVGAPLQRIADAARRFGRGELGARARLRRNDELGEVARAFDEMADRVTTLMTAQRELMANVSHELQTPLARIQVAVDLMVDGIDDRVKELLPEISRDLGEVSRLVDDVMTLSRFDLAHTQGRVVGAPLRLEATPIGELVEAAAARFRASHPERALVLDAAAALPALQLDAVLVRRVLDNLLDNARKYSDADTEIRVSAAPTAAGAVLAVTDRGIGIDPADLAQLFTPFFRTDRSRSRSTGGSGLGLVFARRVVEAHGGSITVASEVRRGTTVTLELPATPPDPVVCP